jgi:lipoprotein signal peptidase
MIQIHHKMMWLTFLFIVMSDQISKYLFIQQGDYHANPGFILQSFQNAPTILRVVFITAIYCFLSVFFILIQSLLAKSVVIFRYFLTIFFASITGNAIDRMRFGFAIDTFPVQIFNTHMVFNLADVFMWIGFIGIIAAMLIEKNQLWQITSVRQQHLIDREYQIKIAFQITTIVLLNSLTLGLISYTLLSHIALQDPNHLKLLIICSAAVTALFALVIFIASIYFSHRTVGPLVALNRYIDQLQRGELDTKFQLREKDELKNLVPIAEKIRNLLSKN